MSEFDERSSLDPRIAKMPFTGDQLKIILEGLDSGVAKSQSPSAYAKGYRDALSAAMSNMRPDTRARFAAAIEGNDKSAAATILDEGIAEKTANLRKQIDILTLDDKNLKEKQDVIKRRLSSAQDIEAMAADPMLQRLGESCFHKFMDAWQHGDVITEDPKVGGWLAVVEKAIPTAPNIFVVQHDWASAFQNATDFSEGEFHLPYSETVFEFRISGRRTCLSMIDHEDGGDPSCMLIVETSVGWAMVGALTKYDTGFLSSAVSSTDLGAAIFRLCHKQARAICIALEAEAAVKEIVRAPHKLNAKRERHGKLPLFDYHVVSLARRTRTLPRNPLEGDILVEHARRRLHFVRGHWRHYANSKTWIRWFLRGDPDLGFIDKHYKL